MFDKSLTKKCIISMAIFLGLVFLPGYGLSAVNTHVAPFITIGMDNAVRPSEVTTIVKIFLLLTVLSLAPAILIMLTSFTRIVIVLSVLRQAIGTHQMPPNQVVLGISLFLTFFVMTPVWQEIHKNAITPYMNGKIGNEEAFERIETPLRKFMYRQTRKKDIALFIDISGNPRPKNIDDVPTSVLVPAFIISELKTAFQIAFMLYIPFLIIDMVVASVLLSMGMMMLPPVMISLPFKLMLFVLCDGWYLIIGSLVKSFS